MLREHNRIATKLTKINPHWNDEKVFQTARIIITGAFQHICFAELMPVFVGKSVLYQHKILYKNKGFVDDYDESINAAPFNEFAQAAFRQGHSLISGSLQYVNLF